MHYPGLFQRAYRKLSGKTNVYVDSYKLEIKKYLSDAPVILEAGACDGRDTLQMAQLWPKAKIHSFEPVPHLFEEAKKKLRAEKNVHFYPMALSGATGVGKLHVSGGDSVGSSSLLTPLKHLEIHPEVTFGQEIDVETYTVDDWATKYRVDAIDFMWLDMQGAELKVLQAAPKIFSTLRVLFTEVSLIETYAGVTLYADLRQWLEQHGFRVVLEDLPYTDMGNVLFIRDQINA